MDFKSIDNSARYLDVAAELDTALTNRFGAYVSPLPSQGRIEGVLSPESSLPMPLTQLPIGEELTALPIGPHLASLQAATGRLTVLAYHHQATGRPSAHPAIIEGASADNKGLRLTFLTEDISTRPIITRLQSMVLRAAVELHAPEVGTDVADSQAATAAEKGHTTMGLRAITDPAVINQIIAGRHPVHQWKLEGIAEHVTQRQPDRAGMYDIEGRPPIEVRNCNLYPNSGYELLFHSSFNPEPYPEGLTAEKIARGLAIVAARKQNVLFTEDKLFQTLDLISKPRSHT